MQASIADPHILDVDPDPDLDPACHFDADPDASFQIKAQNLEKYRTRIGSYSIRFGLSSAN